MTWARRSLGSLFKKSGTERAGSGEYPVLSITMKDGLVDQAEKFKKRVASRDTAKYLVAYKNELVVGFPIDEGVLGFQTKYPAGIVSPAYKIWKLIDNAEAHIPYLERYLRSNQARRIYASKMRGAVARRRSLTTADFLAIQIPFPPLDDQKRIAYLLNKLEDLIAQRVRHLNDLDDLLKSVFIEMFGDPVLNKKNWELGTSREYAEKVTVGVVVKPASHYAENGVIALRSLNIKANYIDLNDLVFFSQEAHDSVLSKSRLQADDIVIVRTGKTGTAAVVPKELDGANCIDLIIVRPRRERLHPLYLTCLLNSERGMAMVASREVGGIQKHFNVGALNKIPFPLPPIDLQNQFAEIVEKIEALKSRYQQSRNDLEDLYGALSQRAFKGVLGLSRVPLHQETNFADHIEEHEEYETSLSIEGAPMDSRDGRERLLRQWFDELMQGPDSGTDLSFDAFWQNVQFRALEYMGEENRPFSSREYETFRDWVFEEIANGKISQAFIEDENLVRLQVVD